MRTVSEDFFYDNLLLWTITILFWEIFIQDITTKFNKI